MFSVVMYCLLQVSVKAGELTGIVVRQVHIDFVALETLIANRTLGISSCRKAC